MGSEIKLSLLTEALLWRLALPLLKIVTDDGQVGTSKAKMKNVTTEGHMS